jgi:hypothetical protein
VPGNAICGKRCDRVYAETRMTPRATAKANGRGSCFGAPPPKLTAVRR